jgi:hypothetical protein
LTPRQQRFVEEYLADLNATQAYKRAGFTAKNDNVAAASASALLRKSKVAAAVQAAFQARAQRTEITQGYVLQALRCEAERTGKGASPSARVRALELLGKHLGMFTNRHSHEHKGAGVVPIQHQHTVATVDQSALVASHLTMDQLIDRMSHEQRQRFLSYVGGEDGLQPPPPPPWLGPSEAGTEVVDSVVAATAPDAESLDCGSAHRTEPAGPAAPW